jgi:hypothetical protein
MLPAGEAKISVAELIMLSTEPALVILSSGTRSGTMAVEDGWKTRTPFLLLSQQ